MNELQIMNIDGVDCYEKDGTAYLKLETVARGLGFTQTQNKNGKEYTSIRWERIEQYLEEFGFPRKWGKDDFIPENIFYRLAMKAKNETAEAFQAKVADEIIPSIRKHGAYMTENTLEAALCNPDYLIELALRLKGETSRRQEAEAMNEQLMIRNKMLEDQAAENQYKVYFAECVMKSKKTITIGEMAKILKQNGVPNMGRNRFYEWLREEGFLIRQKGSDYNTPTQKSMELGLFRIQETPFHTFGGCYGVNKTTKVTPYGQLYFTNLFMKMQLSASEQCAC